MARAVGFSLLIALAPPVARSQQGVALDAARAHARAGRVGSSLKEFDAWLRANPTDGAVLREAATYAFRERRWFEAARWLDQYVALVPSDPSGWYDLGALRHNQCRFDLAIPVFRHLASLEATDEGLARRAEHRFLHGESARRLERAGEAIAELEVAVARAPDRVEYRKALAQALLDGGRFEAAAGEFRIVVGGDPSADNYYGLGLALAETGRIDDAIAALREARRIKSGDARTLLKLGTLSMRAKDLRRAESYLIEARSVAPRNVDVLFALSQAQRLQGNAEDAAQTKAIADELRKEADAANERGRVFSRATVARPNDVDAHVRYAIDLLGQGRLDEAHVILQRLLSFDPANEVAIVNLASLLARQGDASGALKELGKILEVDPGHLTANLQAARIRMALGEAASARDLLRRAVEAAPENVEARELLAAVLRSLGDSEGASRHEADRARLASRESRPSRE